MFVANGNNSLMILGFLSANVVNAAACLLYAENLRRRSHTWPNFERPLALMHKVEETEFHPSISLLLPMSRSNERFFTSSHTWDYNAGLLLLDTNHLPRTIRITPGTWQWRQYGGDRCKSEAGLSLSCYPLNLVLMINLTEPILATMKIQRFIECSWAISEFRNSALFAIQQSV